MLRVNTSVVLSSFRFESADLAMKGCRSHNQMRIEQELNTLVVKLLSAESEYERGLGGYPG
jgi:hypothetical protein